MTRRARAALLACLLVALPASGEERALEAGDGRPLRYTVLDKATRLPSAFPTASLIVGHLAAGRVEEAAKLSNAPERRREVFEDYRAQVGDEEFRRIYSRYLEPANRVIAEVAIGAHRLLVWRLGDAGGAISGQYYVEMDGRFVMDDVPSQTRHDLRRILEDYRKAARAPRPSGRKE